MVKINKLKEVVHHEISFNESLEFIGVSCCIKKIKRGRKNEKTFRTFRYCVIDVCYGSL